MRKSDPSCNIMLCETTGYIHTPDTGSPAADAGKATFSDRMVLRDIPRLSIWRPTRAHARQHGETNPAFTRVPDTRGRVRRRPSPGRRASGMPPGRSPPCVPRRAWL